MDTTQVEKISPDYWLNSHLSIARFSGGCKINGVQYFIDPQDNYLVRSDVFAKEKRQRAKDRKEAKRTATKRPNQSTPHL